MILTPSEYAKRFRLNKKKVSVQTVRKRCKQGTLPSNHIARLLTRGAWAIQVPEEVK